MAGLQQGIPTPGPAQGTPLLGGQGKTGAPMGMGQDIAAAMGAVSQALQFGRAKFGLAGGGSSGGSGAIPDDVPEGDVQPDDQSTTMGYAEGGPVEDDEESFDGVADDTGGGVDNEAPPPDTEGGIPDDQQPVMGDQEPVAGTDPSMPPTSSPQGGNPIADYLRGADATPAATAAAIEHSTGEEDPSKAKYAAIMAAAEEGGPEQAWRLLQSYRQQDQLQRTLAATKLQKGDVQGAVQAANEAMKNVMDGKDVSFKASPDGQQVAANVTDVGGDGAMGRAYDTFIMPVKNFFDFLTGPSGQHDALLQGDIGQTLQAAGAKQANKMQAAGESLDQDFQANGDRGSVAGQVGSAIGGAVSNALRGSAISQAFGGEPLPQGQGIPDSGARPGAGGEVARDMGQTKTRPDVNLPYDPMAPIGSPNENPHTKALRERDWDVAQIKKEQAAEARQKQHDFQKAQWDRLHNNSSQAEARLYGADNVRVANQMFPKAGQQGARAKFLQNITNNQSKERIAGVNAGSRENVANTRSQTDLQKTGLITDTRRTTAEIRAQADLAKEAARQSGANGRQLSRSEMDIGKTLLVNNPRATPEQVVKYILDVRAGVRQPGGGEAPPQGGAPQPQQQAAPQGQPEMRQDPKTGIWWTRTPDGRVVRAQ